MNLLKEMRILAGIEDTPSHVRSTRTPVKTQKRPAPLKEAKKRRRLTRKELVAENRQLRTQVSQLRTEISSLRIRLESRPSMPVPGFLPRSPRFDPPRSQPRRQRPSNLRTPRPPVPRGFDGVPGLDEVIREARNSGSVPSSTGPLPHELSKTEPRWAHMDYDEGTIVESKETGPSPRFEGLDLNGESLGRAIVPALGDRFENPEA